MKVWEIIISALSVSYRNMLYYNKRKRSSTNIRTGRNKKKKGYTYDTAPFSAII